MLCSVRIALTTTEILPAGLLDTSVIIDLDTLEPQLLPRVPKISSVTLAELGIGLHATRDPAERALRLERLQRTETAFQPLPFDTSAARRFTHLAGLVVAAGRSPKPRKVDLMIAAVASTNNLPLYTRNPVDFVGLDSILVVVPVPDLTGD